MNTIELTAVIENLDTGLDFVLNGIEAAGVDRKTAWKIRLACEEVLVNVIHYAYPINQHGNFTIFYELTNDKQDLILKIMDKGVPFNPLEKEDPDVDLPLEDRQIGGLGIFMVRNIMEELTYTREDETNILTMKKSLNK